MNRFFDFENFATYYSKKLNVTFWSRVVIERAWAISYMSTNGQKCMDQKKKKNGFRFEFWILWSTFCIASLYNVLLVHTCQQHCAPYYDPFHNTYLMQKNSHGALKPRLYVAHALRTWLHIFVTINFLFLLQRIIKILIRMTVVKRTGHDCVITTRQVSAIYLACMSPDFTNGKITLSIES